MSIAESLSKRERKGTLRMSNIGKPCDRQLWYEVNSPEKALKLSPATYLKFMYGHLVEELLLFLAELAGHRVEGRQDEQEIEGIKGHRDGIIDGTLIDVKSASSYSFNKFKEGKLKEDDAFGYSDQLQSYLFSGQDDPLITDKKRAAFFVADKTLGHIHLDVHEKEDKDFKELFDQKKKMVVGEIPPRGFEPVPMGQSGNLALGKNCSYCDYKFECWDKIRTFLYSNRPVDLVHVALEPRVPELKRPE